MVLKQSEIDNAPDLGTVWPDNDHYKSFRERKLKLARQRNNGNVGEVYLYSRNGRGIECFFAPDINAKWVENFS